MLGKLYKRIISKMNLSQDELRILCDKLNEGSVCHGPFLKGGKRCPNTTALTVKYGPEAIINTDDVRRYLKRCRVRWYELIAFYILFDISSVFSERYFVHSLKKMRDTIKGELKEIEKE